jgi:hypothetical protein
MSHASPSRSNRLRDLLGAAAVAVGVCVTLSAEAKTEPAARPAPLAERLREANGSLRRLFPDSPSDPPAAMENGRDGGEAPGIHWGKYWANFNPWRNWNNWNNWHNFGQWGNF